MKLGFRWHGLWFSPRVARPGQAERCLAYSNDLIDMAERAIDLGRPMAEVWALWEMADNVMGFWQLDQLLREIYSEPMPELLPEYGSRVVGLTVQP